MNTTVNTLGILILGLGMISFTFVYLILCLLEHTKEIKHLIRILLNITKDRESYRLLLEDLVEVFDSGVDIEQCPAMLKKFSNRANKLLTEGSNDGKRRKQKTEIDCY